MTEFNRVFGRTSSSVDYGSTSMSPLITRSTRMRTMNSFFTTRQSMTKWLSEFTRQTFYSRTGYALQLSSALFLLFLQMFLVVYEISFLAAFSEHPRNTPGWFILLDLFIITYLVFECFIHYVEHDFDARLYLRAKENVFDVIILVASLGVAILYLLEGKPSDAQLQSASSKMQYLQDTDNLTFLGLRIFRDIIWTFRILYFILLLRTTVIRFDKKGFITEIKIPLRKVNSANDMRWFPSTDHDLSESDLEENWIGA